MAEPRKRRLLDQIGESPTFVTEGSRITGDLETTGPLVVCGTVTGDGRVGGTLHMSSTAQWQGEVHAQAAVIAGRITGRLVIADRLEVGATAVIRADIVARTVAIAKGAVIEGAVTVTSGTPVVRFDERRGAVAQDAEQAQGAMQRRVRR
jgi:cytoskeletal protein CcmA (bactofilin family)